MGAVSGVHDLGSRNVNRVKSTWLCLRGKYSSPKDIIRERTGFDSHNGVSSGQRLGISEYSCKELTMSFKIN